jgi:hypothetical protein
VAGELFLRQGTTTIVLPTYKRNYAPGYITIENTERTLDGSLVSDLIAIKRRFDVSWPVIDGEFVASILPIYLNRDAVEFGETQPDNTVAWFDCRLTIPESILREIEIGEFAFSGFALNLVQI